MGDAWCGETVWTPDENGENEFVKRVYEGRIGGGGVTGRTPVKWIH